MRYIVLRTFDILLSLAGFTCSLPIMFVIYIIGQFDTGSPLFFQQRVGKNQKQFELVKFRTMAIDTQSVGTHQVNAVAITKLGSFLRRTKLDELPQLFNVLKGNMSMVGPRPPLPREVGEYEARHFRRLEGMPGITGLWQVSRDGVSAFDQMLRLDFQYLEKWSLASDVNILLRTIRAALGGRGAY